MKKKLLIATFLATLLPATVGAWETRYVADLDGEPCTMYLSHIISLVGIGALTWKEYEMQFIWIGSSDGLIAVVNAYTSLEFDAWEDGLAFGDLVFRPE